MLALNTSNLPTATVSVDPHLPQLDALRAFAVLAVMVNHFQENWSLGLDLGALGVQLFFVLSGFLITRILLRGRDILRTSPRRASTIIRRFYMRRFLRIFPLFYLTLGIAWMVGLPEIRDSVLWHLTYTTNIYFAVSGNFHGAAIHFWSLAVEEQFYLVWPFFMIFTPARWLLPGLWCIAALGPIFRLVGAMAGMSDLALWMLPMGSFDSLALGGLLGFASLPGHGAHSALHLRLTRTGLYIGAPLVFGFWLLNCLHISTPFVDLLRMTLENTASSLLFLWVVGGAAQGFGGVIGRFLEAPVLIYLGKISYGIYIFHLFMGWVVPWFFTRFALPYPTSDVASFSCLIMTTIAAAALSWHFFERPINDLKRRFAF